MSTQMFKSALTNASRIAVRNPYKQFNLKYNDLLYHANQISGMMNDYKYKQSDSTTYPPRITLLVPPSFEYAASTYAIWSNNCISVPLCTTHPVNEMDYYVKDSESSMIIAHSSFSEQATTLSAQNNNIPYLILNDFAPLDSAATLSAQSEIENYAERAISCIKDEDPNLFIYTSGTTSKPKGVVHSHRTIRCNIEMMTELWKWQQDDSVLNVLPMHHIHGLVNITLCALSNGASVTFDSPNPVKIWNDLKTLTDLNVFMAVPTIYAKLIEVFDTMRPDEQDECREICSRFRLMVSGSAALPDSIMRRWYEISGHWLLERYGMTEILMCLSNPYQTDSAKNLYRKPGTVGFPMRNVETKITEDGELYIKSDTMFKEYYNKPDKTREEFTEDGWFKTGDCCTIDEEGYYKIDGRKSIDIIKYGGFKISALDIERVFLEHESIKEIVVLGVPDEAYGEKIGAIVVLKDQVQTDEIREWAKEHTAKYKIPELWLTVDEIPKNAMGKVAKKSLISLFQSNAKM